MASARPTGAEATVYRHVLPQYYHRVTTLEGYLKQVAPDALGAPGPSEETRLLRGIIGGASFEACGTPPEWMARLEEEGVSMVTVCCVPHAACAACTACDSDAGRPAARRSLDAGLPTRLGRGVHLEYASKYRAYQHAHEPSMA